MLQRRKNKIKKFFITIEFLEQGSIIRKKNVTCRITIEKPEIKINQFYYWLVEIVARVSYSDFIFLKNWQS